LAAESGTEVAQCHDKLTQVRFSSNALHFSTDYTKFVIEVQTTKFVIGNLGGPLQLGGPRTGWSGEIITSGGPNSLMDGGQLKIQAMENSSKVYERDNVVGSGGGGCR
jgi:hypothetical protein